MSDQNQPPPAVPPVAAPPPLVPPPPYGQGPWGPPPPSRGGGSKVVLVIGLVALVLVLAAAGGVAAFLLLRDDDGGGDTTASQEEDRADVPEEPEEPATLDPVAVETDLIALSDEVFPSHAARGVLSARSWSTAPGNLDGDQLRDLAGDARLGATEWQVVSRTANHTYSLYVEHIATDYQAARGEPGCSPVASSSYCEVHATPSGTMAYESVYTYDGGGGHYVWIPGDPASGRPEVTISESFGQLEGEPGTEELLGLTDLSVDSMLAALDDPRLRVLPPEELPPLPSFQACSYLESPPSTCPPGLG